MADERSFLQTIKLEISRNFKLTPYERIAFHRILGINKSETGQSILVGELGRGPDIRGSALASLSSFDDPAVLDDIITLLGKDLSCREKILVIDFAGRAGSEKHVPPLMDFIEKNRQSEDPHTVKALSSALQVLSKISGGSADVSEYLLSLVRAGNDNPLIVPAAVEALSHFMLISELEEIIKNGDDEVCGAAYVALAKMADSLQTRSSGSGDADTEGGSSEEDKKRLLDIRVLLGKMTSKFDSYSGRTRVRFINAMAVCNHREYMVYTMKALTSEDPELISMTLFSLYSVIHRLRDTEKLLKSLIAISTEHERDNDLIVEIFVSYCSLPLETREFNILRDRLFGYLVVTLDSYFENYRKDFMVTSVMENSYPESFQRVRIFILRFFSPDIKRRIVACLQQDDPAVLKSLIAEVSGRVPNIDESGRDDLAILYRIMSDTDSKSREISASRIDSINFEKKYLRNRIIRICRIIGRLRINEAASSLVKIYNYIKKYPDKEIMDAVIHTLAMLNYSYLLGEIEVMMNSGLEQDEEQGLSLLSMFSEQRSLNILLEYLQRLIGTGAGLMDRSLSILLEREIPGNVTAAGLCRKIIETSDDQRVKSLAILVLGKCGFDSDIDYLHNMFFSLDGNETREAAVRAIGNIASKGSGYNRRQLVRNLQEYLKEPSIRVRIYSCLLLAGNGFNDAIQSIREMLVIKNRKIQCDILTILGDLRSVEFSFFLLSLLREEYGIVRDIVPVIEMLPEEDLREIDAFVVNLFRKFEAPDLEGLSGHDADRVIKVEGLTTGRMSLVHCAVKQPDSADDFSSVIRQNIRINTLLTPVLEEFNGSIARRSNTEIIACFSDASRAALAALGIESRMREYNSTLTGDRKMVVSVQMLTGTVKRIKGELIDYPDHKLIPASDRPAAAGIIIDRDSMEEISNAFSFRSIPAVMLGEQAGTCRYYELISRANSAEMSADIIAQIQVDEEKKREEQLRTEKEMKRLTQEHIPPSSAAIARDLEEIGNILKRQLDDIEQYAQRRSTDRELIRNLRKMLANTYNRYRVEISRLVIK